MPRDRAKRTLVLAIITSALFHLLLFVPFVTIPGFLQSQTYVKRGEPLLVDIAPERPEEKAADRLLAQQVDDLLKHLQPNEQAVLREFAGSAICARSLSRCP